MNTQLKYKRKESELIAVPLPQQTDSYIPVPNEVVINAIKDRTKMENYNYLGAGYRLAANDQIAAGMMAVQPKGFENSGIVHNISFLNSYNKQRRLKVGSGALILVCTNGMFTENLYSGASHIHSGKVLDMIEPMLDNVFEGLDQRFEALIEQAELLKSTIIPMEALWQVLGNLLMSNVLGTLAVTPLKENLVKDKNFQMFGEGGKMTAWNLYNQITELLKGVPAYRLVDSHVNAHETVMRTLVDVGVVDKSTIIETSGIVFDEVESEPVPVKIITDSEVGPEVQTTEDSKEDSLVVAEGGPTEFVTVDASVQEVEDEEQIERMMEEQVLSETGVTMEEVAKLPDDVAQAVLNNEDVEDEAKF